MPAGVLIVEDEIEIAELIEFHLEKDGMSCSIVQSGRDALVEIRRSPPDLLVLDRMLPDVDGMDVCRKLKSDAATRDIPIIMVTAKDSESDKYQARAMPRDFNALAKVLDRAAHSYNYGIRAYYFAMAALAWFINDWVFMAACAVIILVLYRREFKSSSLNAMVAARLVDNVHEEDEVRFD